jgi:hypothetical protein
VLASRAMRRAAAVAGVAFAALFLSNGSSQTRLFWIGAAAVIVAAVGWTVAPPTLSRPALVFFAALAAFVLWQAASIAWSIQPARSWDYSNRGLAYLSFAAVGALVAGRQLAYAAALLLGALFAWALAAKAIPGIYDDYDRLARLRYPVGYWNELALLAAASVPVGLWLLRRSRVAGALLLYLALVVVVLTYSRVGIVLTLVAAIAWLVLDEEWLESIGPLGVAWIAGALVAAVGLVDGLLFGLALLAGGAAVALALRYVVTRAVDRRVVRTVAVALAAIVLAAFLAAVVRAGGPGDFVSDRWHEFSNPVSTQVGNTPQRIVSTSSSNRWRWWQEAWNAFVDHPLQGTGAGTFGLTDRIERDSPLAVTEPHSAPLQDLTETGLVGFVLIAVATIAAIVAIARRDKLPLALSVGICMVHSLVDIDWDYVAVQGPLFLTIGALAAGPPRARRGWLPAAVAGACALAALYSLASPWLAKERLNAAFDSLIHANPVAARDEARSAHSFNPLAVEPLWLLGALTAERKYYVQARDLEPKNPETWYELGSFELNVLHRPRAAYRDLNHAYTLDNFLFAKRSTPARDLDVARCMVDPSTCR